MFEFNGKEYEYHAGAIVERYVELPIIYEYIKQNPGKRILEIGNVLFNYFGINHTVLDKYDPSGHVIKLDIDAYTTEEKFDLIVSISTLEHVGYEPPEELDEKKVIRVIDHIKNSLLNENGLFVFTVPLGYNKKLDEQFMDGSIKLDEVYFMKRIEDYKWVQDFDTNTIGDFYDNPFGCGNKIIIGVVK